MLPQKSKIKVYLVFTVVLTVTLGVILFVVRSNTNDIISELTLNRVLSANRELVNYLQNLQNSTLRRTESVAQDGNIIDLIRSGDRESLKVYLKTHTTGIDLINVCDRNGIVLARTPLDIAGDDISIYKGVSSALRTGVASISIEELHSHGGHFSVYASAPVFDGGNLIGAVNSSYDLEKTEFLEALKDQTGCYSSIFKNDRRINTTLLDRDGNRAVGTRVDGDVVKTVIGAGNVYTGRQVFFGKMYEVCFSPLVSNGQIIGMLGACYDIDSTVHRQRTMNYLILIAFFTGLTATGILILLSNRAVKSQGQILEKLLNEKEVSFNMMERLMHTMTCHIYVTEMKTDKILFVNDSMKKAFGLTGNIKGESCWKFFQSGFDKRCDFCPKYKLEINPDEIVVWEERNSVTGRYYRHTDRVIDWHDGTKVHFQQCDDVTGIKSALALEKQLEQQTLMASISRSFLSDADIDTLITENLRIVGEFMQIPQALFFKLDDDGTSLICHNEWIDPKLGLGSRIGGKMPLMEPMLSIIKSFKPGIGRDACLYSNDPVIKEAMSPYRVNFESYITTPVFRRGKMTAVIDFSREDDGREWSDSEINLATLFASTLSGVFERDAMERQYSIVENTPSIVLYIGEDGSLAYFNLALIVATGYTGKELEAGGFDLIFDEQTVRVIKGEFIPQTLQNGTDRREFTLKCRNGRRRILETSSFIVRKNTIAAIATDVTEERTLRTELIAAKELAERANRTKSDFLSRMSHEMRTPMNVIMGMTTLARKTNNLVEKEDFLRKSDNASRHLLQLINDVLDITEIEDGNFSLACMDFSFGAMLQNILSVINLYTDEKHQTLSVNIDPSMPDMLRGDEHRLGHVIYHLLMNAVKFTPDEGSIQIGARTTGEENGVFTLQIEIIDSGIGITREQQEIIFDSFEQVYGGTKRKYGGIGLGLALSKRIIELMDGKIQVESKPGKGSKFIFIVKIEKGRSEESRAADVEEVPDSDESTVSFEGKTVLLVEDIEINREIVIALLEDTQIKIENAENGRQALDMFSAAPEKYDIILMDINMPEMDGVEATRRIRAFDEHGARVPIIATTANILPDDVKSYLAAGMNDHIGKPIDFHELLTKIEKYTKKA